MKQPIVGITMGDAAGIGPEISVKVLTKSSVYQICRPLLIGDSRVLKGIIDDNKYNFRINIIRDVKEAKFTRGTIDMFDLENIDLDRLKTGKINAMCGKAAVEYIKKAVRLITDKQIGALITAPLCKESMHKAGFQYAGHTELLARLSKTKNVVMMLIGGTLKTVLVTTHFPLKDISKNLTKQKIFQVLKITNQAMKKFFKIDKPKIIVASLNPHCGEGGILGDEEKRVISPAVNKAIKEKIDVVGPFPPDKTIYEAVSGRFDVAVVMYHDQALIPLKMVAFDKGVNLTVGLPFIRTSPDHGTAFNIAGQDKADPSSMKEAIKLAIEMATNMPRKRKKKREYVPHKNHTG